MDKQLEAQLSTAKLYPVSRKQGKVCQGLFNGRPNLKKLSEGKRLVLLIGLENSKKVRNLVARKRVRLIDYSAIAAEVQGDEAIEDWQTFQLETNNLFYRRVKSALSKGIAVVDRNFRNLEIRLGFLEVSSISGSIESVLLVDRKLLQKDSYLQQQATKGLLPGRSGQSLLYLKAWWRVLTSPKAFLMKNLLTYFKMI